MKANELRIGNFITVHGELQEVCHIPLPANCTDDVTKPIPITEEWMKKIPPVILGCKTYCHEHFADDTIWFLHIGNEFALPIKYVHQLQNLYFTLIGEELNIT